MKALSLLPMYAEAIALGIKTIELRTWQTKHRGDLLICSSTNERASYRRYSTAGHAIAVVNLVDIVPYSPEHAAAADVEPDFQGRYSWLLDNVRPIKPFPVKGKLNVFEVDASPEYLDLQGDDVYWYWVESGLLEIHPDLLEDA